MNIPRQLIWFLLFTEPILNRADPLDTWILRRGPSPTQIPLRSVVYGGGKFVAVGDGIIASLDGVTWTASQSDLTNCLASVTYGNNRFVAVGEAGTVLSSTNGLEWSPGIMPTDGDLTTIAYAAGQFVAAARGVNPITDQWEGTVLTSQNGVNWVQRQTGTSYTIDTIGYGNGRFVATGWDSSQEAGVILTSTDAVNWAQSPLEVPPGTRFGLNPIAYGNGEFIAIGGCLYGDCSTNVVLASADGISWHSNLAQIIGEGGSLVSVTYGGGQYVAADTTGTIVSSTDGLIWATQRVGDGEGLAGLAYGSNQFVAVGWWGSIFTSDDGVTWTQRQKRRPFALSCVAYANDRFVALENDRPSFRLQAEAFISVDGVNWAETAFETMSETGDPHYPVGSSITFANGTFVAVGGVDYDTAWIGSSTNGVNWVDRLLVSFQGGFSGIAYGNRRLVAIGGFSSLDWTSSDGVNWNSGYLAATNSPGQIAYGNGKFVALAGEPTVPDWTTVTLTSTDGVNWSKGPARWPGTGYAIDFGGGTFVAVGSSGGILTSPDGVNWTQREAGTQMSLTGVAHGDNGFIAVGAAGTILTSVDGIAWVQRPSGTQYDLCAAAYGNGRLIVVGQYGTILESGSLVHLALKPKLDASGLELSVTGPVGSTCAIQTSIDLISWRNLANLTPNENGEAGLEIIPQGSQRLFYRAFSP